MEDQPEHPVLAALRGRRSIYRFRPEPVPREFLERILEAGTWAPNHRLTEPWRFTVVGPELKERLGPYFARRGLRKLPPDASEERRAAALEAGLRKWGSKPSVVIVTCLVEGDALRREEDYAATACAIQNMQLAAWALGVGAQWSTGGIIGDREALALAGIPEEERVVGILYLGFPAEEGESRRRPVEAVTRWRG